MIPVKESPPPPLVEAEEDSSSNDGKTTTNDEVKLEAKVCDEPLQVQEEEDTEVNVIQKVLQKVKDEQDEGVTKEKQMLVDDLDEIELEENEHDDFDANMKGFEDGGVPNRTTFNAKNEEDEDFDEVNVDEQDEEGDSNKPKISIKVTQSKPSKLVLSEVEHQEVTIEDYDFSIVDELFGILDLEQDLIEPILCGYFNKVV